VASEGAGRMSGFRRDRAEQWIELLEEEVRQSPVGWNMCSWGEDDHSAHERCMTSGEPLPRCATAACAAGHLGLSEVGRSQGFELVREKHQDGSGNCSSECSNNWTVRYTDELGLVWWSCDAVAAYLHCSVSAAHQIITAGYNATELMRAGARTIEPITVEMVVARLHRLIRRAVADDSDTRYNSWEMAWHETSLGTEEMVLVDDVVLEDDYFERAVVEVGFGTMDE
jgi:hypothetical protein